MSQSDRNDGTDEYERLDRRTLMKVAAGSAVVGGLLVASPGHSAPRLRRWFRTTSALPSM